MPALRALVLLATALLALAVTQPAAAQSNQPDVADLVRTELLVEPSAIAPGQPFWAAIRLTMKEHWHTYWRNPGDAGTPTEIAWKLPAGFKAEEIVWPTPSLIRVGPAVSFGYEGEAMLLVRITPPQSLPADVKLDADVSFLVCEKICIPGDASVSLTVPSTKDAGTPPANALFDAARRTLPQPSPWTAQYSADAKTITIGLDAASLRGDAIRSATFFPHSNDLILNGANQTFTVTESGAKLSLERSQIAAATAIPSRIDGVLVLEEDVGGSTIRNAFTVSASGPGAGADASAGNALRTIPTVPAIGSITLMQAVALALIAGVILNLMPCVFPVLSIKILHLTQHAGEPPARVRMHGLAYTAGILVSFALLAGALYAARAAGAEVGWGFQLQSPVVVATLAFILFAFALSLSGVLDIGASLTRIGGSRLMQRGGLSGSFFAGTLATLVATPCTAPFMGASIGFALTQSVATGMAVFLALGLGLALPFLVLSFLPGLQRLLPRPGAWMETLKSLLAFPLYATVAWLVWVLSFEVGPSGLLMALFGLVLIAFAAFTLRAARQAKAGSRIAWRASAAAAVAGIVAIVIAVHADRVTDTASAATATAAAETNGGAEPFTQARFDTLLAEQRPVFINMTAAWCITCLVNERTALSTENVRAAFEKNGVAYLKGDWTNRNPEITRLLQRYGRSGVPLYVFYPPGKEPAILPQILTESLVLDHVKRL
ncbi:MAG: protein-disulfide reductase DsbD family protein [Pseudorhodoplanes sp.]